MKTLSTLILLSSLYSMAMESNDIVFETKTLYIVRHSKSDKSNPDWKDIERPLAERGRNEAPMMGKRLNNMGVYIDYVLSSPSERTRQSVALFAPEVPFEKKRVEWNNSLYTGSMDSVLQVIYNIDNQYKSVMIFGHNPAFTDCANFLQKDTIIENLPTSGIFAIEFQTDSWQKIKNLKGKFLFMDYPKKEQ